MPLRPGDTQSKPYLFDQAGIIAFAERAGDMNPLHSDPAVAAAGRFHGLIASGAHMTAVLMGSGASMIADAYESVGLEFTFRFERAIKAGTSTLLTWTITSAEPHAKLGGTLLQFEGEISDGTGKRFVAASGKAVVWDKPPGSG